MVSLHSFSYLELAAIRSISTLCFSDLFYPTSKFTSVKRVTLLTALMFVLFQLDAKIIYVKAGSTGNGTSWENALGQVQDALQRAKAGDQIWVAAGTYYTTNDNNRHRSFVINDGIALYGGFAGIETSLSQRVLADNPTYLSGEIGTASRNDNAFTVVYTENVSSSTIVDGFIITNGMANGSNETRHLEIGGAGWYNLATDGNQSSPIIRNCIFTGNQAREGAAIFNRAIENGICKPQILDSKFNSNKADFEGGAIVNYSENGECAPRIINSVFNYNEASYGACVYNKAKSGKVAPYIQNCVFTYNIAYIRDGGIHTARSTTGAAEAILVGCRLEHNKAGVGAEAVVQTPANNQIEADFKSSGF
jgi:hypothetical protein